MCNLKYIWLHVIASLVVVSSNDRNNNCQDIYKCILFDCTLTKTSKNFQSGTTLPLVQAMRSYMTHENKTS